MNTFFKRNIDSRYSLRQISQFSSFLVRLVYHGTESTSYLGPKRRDILPDDYKAVKNLDTFKIKINKWNQNIAYVGYVKFTLIE